MQGLKLQITHIHTLPHEKDVEGKVVGAARLLMEAFGMVPIYSPVPTIVQAEKRLGVEVGQYYEVSGYWNNDQPALRVLVLTKVTEIERPENMVIPW